MNPVRHVNEESALLHRRLKWFLFFRLTVAILGIGAILIYHGLGEIKQFPSRIIAAYSILVFACFVNILYLLLINKKWLNLKKLALFQIAVDIFLETGLAYFTGGSGSIFVSFYFASILAANTLVSARASFVFASASSILLSIVTIIYSLSAHRHFPLPLLPDEYVKTLAQGFQFILPYLFFFALMLHFVSYSSGRLARELKHERTLKEEIIQHIINGLIVVNTEGRIIFWNNQALQLLQVPEETKLGGRAITQVLAGENYRSLREALKNNQRVIQEITMPTGWGENLIIEVTTSPLWDEQNKQRGKIAILNDVSLKKKMDEIVKRTETLQALSTMSISIAHEIRNPLASIKGAIQEIKSIPALRLEDKKLMEIVIKESDRLNKIVTDFLEFARPRPVLKQKYNLAELLKEVTALLRNQFLAKNVDVHLQVPALLYGEFDPEQIKQVFINLGLNALEASAGNRKTKVVIKSYFSSRDRPGQAIVNHRTLEIKPDLGLTVEVIDFGKGIKSDDLKHIYEPFFTTKSKGIGLGLTIAYKIIQEHKGQILVESQEGRGSKFFVWVPSE
ncbi:MAG: ATP-binding protein [Planctomycetota bacterium]